MGTHHGERGFTLVELMIASVITMVVMGVAFSTFQNALRLNDTVVQLTDSSQNLRAGTNLLLRDLAQAGRNIPVGGISIPSVNADPVVRPGPEEISFSFNEIGPSLRAITTGAGRGPAINGRSTDLITIVMDDPFLPALEVYPSDATADMPPTIALDGSSLSVGAQTEWLTGDPQNGIAPIQPGDLIYFAATGTGTALQTVTRVDETTMYFESNAADAFNLNQRDATAGSITQILPADPCGAACESAMTVRRVLMYTYWVEEEASGVPRLMRALNHGEPVALAGVIEDLEFHYDLVDAHGEPARVSDLPYPTTPAEGEVQNTASQIRKVNVHVGVRSDSKSASTGDFLRSHLSTVISIRNLAYVSRYNTGDDD